MRETLRGTVILDLDGTLVDSAPDLADCLDLLLAERGLEPVGVDETRRLIGHGIPRLVEAGFAFRGEPLVDDALLGAVARFRDVYVDRLSVKTQPYPGVEDGLSQLRAAGWRLVVCTNKLERYARAILADLGLAGRFDAVAGPDTFGVSKPDPRHLLRLLPGDGSLAVMVGDSEIDVMAARAADIAVVAVTYGYCRTPVQRLKPDAVAARFADVPAAVEACARAFPEHRWGGSIGPPHV
jgi:phosphoglycolate phosphatase